MSLLHNKPTKLGIVAGKIKASGAATNVYAGSLTAGTFDAGGSGLVTFPPFISAPAIVATYEGFGTRTANITNVQLTGATVSNVYVSIGTTPASGGTIHLVAIGEVKL